MKRVTLGGGDLAVSAICLGTMTFGNQTPEAQSHAQMDRALEAGITFLDTAEMYPVNPVRRETVGRSEEILGDWLAARGGRDGVEIATKATGPGDQFGKPFTFANFISTGVSEFAAEANQAGVLVAGALANLHNVTRLRHDTGQLACLSETPAGHIGQTIAAWYDLVEFNPLQIRFSGQPAAGEQG